MKVGDDAVITGDMLLAPERMTHDRLGVGELVSILEIDEFVMCALVWGADTGAQQWIALESLTPLGTLFGGFLEGAFDE